MSALRKLRHNLTGILGKGILWLWAKSGRTSVLGEEKYTELRSKNIPVILLVWHGRIFLGPYFFRRRGIMTMISPSEDGEFIAQIISRWGFRVLRGSSSHSVVKAWIAMKKELEKGGELIVVPDGPRGPEKKFKPGALKLAKETGAYLVPFTFSSSKRKILRSWDQFMIPRPFARFVAMYGEPISVSPDLEKEEMERKLLEVEENMIELDRRADVFFETS